MSEGGERRFDTGGTPGPTASRRSGGRRRGGVAVRRGRALAAALWLITGLGGCGERAGAPGAQEGTPVYGGTVVIGGLADLEHMNSLVAGEVWSVDFLNFALFVTPLRLSRELELEPYLVRSWELLGDTGVVFHLRDDVFWHDGVRTTAYDLAFTYDRVKDPETAFPKLPEYFGSWGDVEVVDSFTVRFGFEPHSDPLLGWTATAVMPRHLLESIPPAQLRQAEFNKQPVGNGPFRFVSYRANDRWVFEANPDFPEELGGRPYLNRVVWRVIPEAAVQEMAVQTGEIDLAAGIQSRQIAVLDARPDLRAIIRPSRIYHFIGWNGRRPPLGDPRVRRALTLAIDRREIVDGLRAGIGELAAGPIHPFHWAFESGLEPLPHDPDAARRLLAEAGFRDRTGDGFLEDEERRPFRFAMTIPAGSEFNRNVAEKVQSDLARVGVRMDVRASDASTMIADVFGEQRRFDAVILAWESGFRLDLRSQFHSAELATPFQLASYANPEVDEILDVAPSLMDADAALPLWHRFQEIMRDEQPWTFLYYTPDAFILRERVRAVEMDIRGRLITLPGWWLARP